MRSPARVMRMSAPWRPSNLCLACPGSTARNLPSPRKLAAKDSGLKRLRGLQLVDRAYPSMGVASRSGEAFAANARQPKPADDDGARPAGGPASRATDPQDSAPPAAPDSAHGYTASSWSHPGDPIAPAPYECPPHPPADASQTNAVLVRPKVWIRDVRLPTRPR